MAGISISVIIIENGVYYSHIACLLREKSDVTSLLERIIQPL